MKVRVDYNGQKQFFDGVEDLTFEDFKAIVAAQYGITSEFTLLLGTNIVNLQGHQKLPEFDIVNSDILRVETIDDVTNASMDTTTALELTTQPSSSASPPEQSPTELVSFITQTVENLVDKHGFRANTLLQQPTDNPLAHRIGLSHPDAALQAELCAEYFRDLQDSNQVTSASISTFKFRTGYPAVRQLLISFLLYTDTPNISAVLNEILANLREEVIGPENKLLNSMFFRGIGRSVLLYLKPKDILNLERTCRYAAKKCRSPAVEHDIWKAALRRKYGDAAVSQCERTGTPYRAAYRQRYEDDKRRTEEERRAHEDVLRRYHEDAIRHPPQRPLGPLGPLPYPPAIPNPRNPLGIPPPNNPPFGPMPGNPWEDPLRRDEIFPQRRPPGAGGYPRIFPTGGDLGGFGPGPDPDMPQGPRSGDLRQPPRGPGYRPPNFDPSWYG